MYHWGMFALGVICGWLLLSVVGVPALAWVLASLHRDERLRLMAENCRLRARVEELER